MKKTNKFQNSEKRSRLKKKIKEKIVSGVVYVKATFSNTIITLTRLNGDVLAQSSGGTIGYKGTKKSTPYAAQLCVSNILEIARNYGMVSIEVKTKGFGPGRNSVLRVLSSFEGIKLNSISDLTPLPHNGCRPPKKPRV